jgi:uroporphyrinogen-III synthase
MLQHYNTLYKNEKENPALLFLVGEQRRDIIPKTLMNAELADDIRIPVEEVVVYETGEMGSFEGDFKREIEGIQGDAVTWVVVFSPSGCEAMLRVLGLGPFAKDDGTFGECGKKIFVATIGPTTRDHLRGLGFEPHVCAEKPSPEGVGEGIKKFMEERRLRIETSTVELVIARGVDSMYILD